MNVLAEIHCPTFSFYLLLLLFLFVSFSFFMYFFSAFLLFSLFHPFRLKMGSFIGVQDVRWNCYYQINHRYCLLDYKSLKFILLSEWDEISLIKKFAFCFKKRCKTYWKMQNLILNFKKIQKWSKIPLKMLQLIQKDEKFRFFFLNFILNSIDINKINQYFNKKIKIQPPQKNPIH